VVERIVTGVLVVDERDGRSWLRHFDGSSILKHTHSLPPQMSRSSSVPQRTHGTICGLNIHCSCSLPVNRNAKCPGINLPNVGMAAKTGEVVPVSARRTYDESCSNGLANCGRHRCCKFLIERVAVRASGCQDLLDAVFAEVQMQVAMALADAGMWRGIIF
jgi:hypothetical protein